MNARKMFTAIAMLCATGLSMNLGTLFDGLGCFPFEHGAYPPHSDCKASHLWHSEFDMNQYRLCGHQHFSALPPQTTTSR